MYLLVFVMMWCASHIKTLCMKVEELKNSNSGTYQGLELQGPPATASVTPTTLKATEQTTPGYALEEDLEVSAE